MSLLRSSRRVLLSLLAASSLAGLRPQDAVAQPLQPTSVPRLDPRVLPRPVGEPPPVGAPPPAAEVSQKPHVAILSTPFMAGKTDLIIQPIDQKEVAPPVASFSHLPGTTVRGEVIPSTRSVAAVASTELRQDPAFGGALLLVQPNEEAKQLADRVYRGTRPVVLADGRVFVQRGEEGEEPNDEQIAQGQLRVDRLSIDEVDTQRGTTRIVTKFEGYIAFLVGALEPELVVYLVQPQGASLVAVNIASGAQRTLASIPPFARDLSIDVQARAVLLTNVDESTPGRWQVMSVPIGQPAGAAPPVNILEKRLPMSAVATAWPGRSLAVSDGTARLRIKSTTGSAQIAAASNGVIRVQDFYKVRTETFAVGVQRAAGQRPSLFVVSETGAQLSQIAAPENSQLEVAGVILSAGPSAVQPAAIRQQIPSVLRRVQLRTDVFKPHRLLDDQAIQP